MTPGPMTPDASGPSGATPQPGPRPCWTERAAAVLFALLCLEVGLFLLVYPWTGSWNWNILIAGNPRWAPMLQSDQFRGAVSGLGILNIFIGVLEAFRLRRFSGS
jgi:hypothetical protein